MDNVTQLAHFEIMQRCIVPVDDDIPNPEIDFNACCEAVIDRVERSVYSLPRRERDAYFLEKARGALAWCKANRAPLILTKQVRRWLVQLQAPGGNRRSSSGR